MNQFRNIIFSEPLEFQVTRPSPCSYLDNHVEQRLAADLSRHAQHHDSLAEAGFRRVENWVYKPICQNCNACLPIRIASGKPDEGKLKLSRNQKRVMSRNADLVRQVLPNYSRKDHYDLFSRYLNHRHSDGQMAEMDEDKYAAMISCSPIETVLVEYRLEDNPVAVVMVDIQRDGLSAVYSFFDPELDARSLGTFMVLDCAALAHDMGLPYVYLGYFIRNCGKMNYKSRFKPAEIMVGGKWQPLETTD